jgi:Ulp1 family protease
MINILFHWASANYISFVKLRSLEEVSGVLNGNKQYVLSSLNKADFTPPKIKIFDSLTKKHYVIVSPLSYYIINKILSNELTVDFLANIELKYEE